MSVVFSRSCMWVCRPRHSMASLLEFVAVILEFLAGLLRQLDRGHMGPVPPPSVPTAAASGSGAAVTTAAASGGSAAAAADIPSEMLEIKDPTIDVQAETEGSAAAAGEGHHAVKVFATPGRLCSNNGRYHSRASCEGLRKAHGVSQICLREALAHCLPPCQLC